MSDASKAKAVTANNAITRCQSSLLGEAVDTHSFYNYILNIITAYTEIKKKPTIMLINNIK